MPDELTYEEVTATLIVEDQELVVTHQDREISRHPYPLRKRCPVGTHHPPTGNDVLAGMN